MGHWSLTEIPDLSDTHVVVTGATSGIGTPTAAALANAGARLSLLGRSPSRVATARVLLQNLTPHAQINEVVADLSDLSSIRSAAHQLAEYGPLNLLVNNAGILSSTYQT